MEIGVIGLSKFICERNLTKLSNNLMIMKYQNQANRR